MGVQFVAKKCTQCAGRLEYIKEKKVWRCLYCGAEIERQEQYDGLFTIKNVVRQSLLDTAYRRLDSAEKNLTECEKIDSRYVGTLIARITYQMISVITPGACPERDLRNLFAQLKKNYEQLRELFPTVGDEEEALYEFLEESDIFATLVLVYDSLNDTARRDTVLQLLDAGQIYSQDANCNLLTYALKNNQIQLADGVLGNTDNLDLTMALSEVLRRYPDGEAKGQRVDALLRAGTPGRQDRAALEQYLTTSQDGIDTRAAVAEHAVANGVDISVEFVVDKILPSASPERILSLLSACCGRKLCDDDVMRILEYACSCGSADVAEGALDCLQKGDQYVLVPGKTVIALLSRPGPDAQEKLRILRKLFSFQMEAKTVEAVVTNYLCFNQDPAATRKEILPFLLEKATAIPTSTVQNYVLQCTADGEEKPAVVRAIFEKEFNKSFHNELLSKYMAACPDSDAVQDAIVEILSSGGLKMDPGALVDYICGSDDDVPSKIEFVKKMVGNGSQLRSDAASAYLEKTDPQQFSSELFSLIVTPASTFSPAAVERYLLWCRDREAVKVQNFQTIAERCAGGVGSISCQVEHGGNSVSCSLLQAYVLCSTDSQSVTQAIVDWLISGQKLKINAEVTASGRSMKFKKYVVANRERLSETADVICQQYRVYSMLF